MEMSTCQDHVKDGVSAGNPTVNVLDLPISRKWSENPLQ